MVVFHRILHSKLTILTINGIWNREIEGNPDILINWLDLVKQSDCMRGAHPFSFHVSSIFFYFVKDNASNSAKFCRLQKI